MMKRPELVRQLATYARKHELVFEYWSATSGLIARRIRKVDPGAKGRLIYKGVVTSDDISSTIARFNDLSSASTPL